MGLLRADGFMNILSGLNAPGLDRSVFTNWSRSLGGGVGFTSNMQRFWASQLGAFSSVEMYRSRGVASTIVDRPADDAFARGVMIKGDDDNLMANEFDRLLILTKFADAIRWARLFGGSAIVILAKDGGDWSDPLNLDSLDSVEDLRVYDNTQIRRTEYLFEDPNDPMYGKPEIYSVAPVASTSFDVHFSRIIPIAGDPLPGNVSQVDVFWQGRSVLDVCGTDVARLEQGLEWALRLLERKQQGIFKMEGLGELFAHDREDMVRKSIDLVDMVRSNLNSVVVDKEDDYTILNLGLEGIQLLIQEFQIALCSSSGMPAVMLFGKSTTGLNATGVGDLENYYGMIGRIQTRIARPALERLISILWVQRQLRSQIPDEWKLEFNPLWIPTEKEQADVALVKAQAANTETNMLVNLVNAGILLPEEVRTIVLNRYANLGLTAAPLSSGGDIDYSAAMSSESVE